MSEQERINMARARINAAINEAGTEYGIQPYLMELVLSSALSDIRAQANIIQTIKTNNEVKNEGGRTENERIET